MSTPAININKSLYTDSSETAYYYGNVDYTTPGKSLTSFKQEFRPESGTNRKSISGWRAPSPWEHSLVNACPTSTVRYKKATPNPNIFSIRDDGFGWDNSISDFPSFPNELIARAEIKALLKLKNQKVNLAQAFAEREQTVRLFVDAASTIAKSVRAFRSGNPKSIWALIKAEGSGPGIPRRWLELQYGWNPLMSDVYGSADLLQSSNGDGKAFRASVSAVVKQTSPISWVKSSSSTSDFGIQVQGKLLQGVKVRLDYTLENPFLALLSQVGVTNPVYLAWELLPYSFVVDWFSRIGDWLSSMDAATGWSLIGGSCTVLQKLDEKGIGIYNRPSLDAYYTYSALSDPSSYFNNRMSMRRTIYTSSPLPAFPGIKNPFSSGHIANALSLLVTAFH